MNSTFSISNLNFKHIEVLDEDYAIDYDGRILSFSEQKRIAFILNNNTYFLDVYRSKNKEWYPTIVLHANTEFCSGCNNKKSLFTCCESLRSFMNSIFSEAKQYYNF